MILSIITPFFNTEPQAFRRLATSISNQTVKTFEWIIINDGSDETYKRALKKTLSIRDIKGLKIIDNAQNRGAAQSRNRGVQEARGEYIVFVDSDDYICKDFVGEIARAAARTKAGIIFFDYFRVKKGKTIKCKTLRNHGAAGSQPDRAAVFMSTNVCGKAVQKEIITKNNIRFPDLKRYEDWVFMIKALSCAKGQYCLIPKALYYYCDHAGSMVHKYSRDGNRYAQLAFAEIQNFIADEQLLETLYIREVLYTAIRDNIRRIGKKEFYTSMEQITARYPHWIQNKDMAGFHFKQKLVIYIYRALSAILS